MFSFQEYVIGWSIYLFAVVALLFVFWRMTRFISWAYVRDCVRLLGAVFLLLPVTVDDSTYYWAPAWIKALLNIIFENIDVFWSIAQLFLLALCVTYLVYFLLSFFILLFNKARPQRTSIETTSIKTSIKTPTGAPNNTRKEPRVSVPNA